FPGTPVAVLHTSRDGHWWFVASERYSAWIEQRRIALGDAVEVFRYADSPPPYLIVTGAAVETVFTPERPSLSKLRLDMGVRSPLLPNRQHTVNGQHPFTAYTIELPERRADGTLRLTPALIPRSADVATDYLPLTPRNLLTQSFKFLGERYGWGHAYEGRDCSGLVSEIYASFGVLLPRNTGDQAASPALNRIAFDTPVSHEQRLQTIRALQVGDLVYIPGHVMLVIGHADGMTWVIHDTVGVTYLDDDGQPQRITLNGVSVTPLEPLRVSATESYIDRITAIQRLRP
ncbi:MAG: SH3 domain-containing protein, partial [Xanthomonadaceae bacterium]|nr:SH3 domain-containing protein [Xanthomonadaceae bacterium]